MSKLTDLAIKKLAMRKVAADSDRMIGAATTGLTGGFAGHLVGRAASRLPKYRNVKNNPVNSIGNYVNSTFDTYGQAIKDIPETAEVLSDPDTYKGMYYNARDRFGGMISGAKQFGQNLWDVISRKPMNAYAAPDPATKAYLDSVKDRRNQIQAWYERLWSQRDPDTSEADEVTDW